jgi:mannose-1-phosphate guanylyltransferase
MAAGPGPWVIVLAGGDGARLRALTTTRDGVAIPKQFCTFGNQRSLLATSLERARRLAPDDRIVTVVAAQHRTWWKAELEAFPRANVVVQPQNRGTALGILLPLLHVAARDPEATVAILPSDHHVEDELIVGSALQAAVSEANRRPDRVVLLGMIPDEPEPSYGWIVPTGVEPGRARDVACFVEKPDRTQAVALMQAGALWSSFMMAARAQALVALFERALPEVTSAFWALRERRENLESSAVLDRIYADLRPRDFSRDVLESQRDYLRVLLVPSCGWSDLGTPQRVARWLGRGENVPLAEMSYRPALLERHSRQSEPG